MSYLIEKAKDLCPNKGYKDLLERYDSLPKNSFDYAVLEAESSLAGNPLSRRLERCWNVEHGF
jgi:mannose-1-phosphate guanylyltransferase